MKSLCALGFCAFTVAAVLYLPSAGWLWAGLTAGGVALFLLLLVWLRRRAGLDLTAYGARSFWGRGTLCLLMGWNFLILGAAAGNLCAAYPTGTPYPVVGLFLLLMAAWAAGKGAAEPVAAIVFFFLAALYALLLAFALPQTAFSAPTVQASWTLLPGALSPVCVLYLCRADGQRVRVWPWLLGGVGLAVLCALVCSGISGNFPFYAMTQSLSLFGIVERFEPLVSVGLTAGGFCLLALLCCINGRALESMLPKAGRRFAVVVNFSLGCAGLWLSQYLSAAVLATGTAIFWGALPLGTLLVANTKKFRKNEKKC